MRGRWPPEPPPPQAVAARSGSVKLWPRPALPEPLVGPDWSKFGVMPPLMHQIPQTSRPRKATATRIRCRFSSRKQGAGAWTYQEGEARHGDLGTQKGRQRNPTLPVRYPAPVASYLPTSRIPVPYGTVPTVLHTEDTQGAAAPAGPSPAPGDPPFPFVLRFPYHTPGATRLQHGKGQSAILQNPGRARAPGSIGREDSVRLRDARGSEKGDTDSMWLKLPR